MKKLFFPRLALTGIKSSRRLYLPYIFTCTGMIIMYYIIAFLCYNPVLDSMRGGANMQMVLSLGRFVIAVFALIFLFYTNSFLIRRRKKEFGLYNILGMNKLNIARILFFESVIVAAISLAAGLLLGIGLSKLAELCMLHIIRIDTDFSLRVSAKGLWETAGIFAGIFVLIYLNSLLQLRRTSAIDLFHAENVGEKPPRGNIVFALIGLVLLVGAYYIAVTIKTPLKAMGMFFVAVIMVIVATYLLFITGSVVFCRFLQRRKSYYYKPSHFVSVSSMVYRMKRNGAGLASICILSTMVLVMISSTTSLYIGADDALSTRYPRNMIVRAAFNPETYTEENVDTIRRAVEQIPERYGVKAENICDYRAASISGLFQDGHIEPDLTKISGSTLAYLDNVCTLYFVPLEDYNKMSGENVTLADGEALIYLNRMGYPGDTFSIGDDITLHVKAVLPEFCENGESSSAVTPSMYIVVPNFDSFIKPLETLCAYNGDAMLNLKWFYGYDIDAPKEVHYEIEEHAYDAFENMQFEYVSCESLEESRAEFFTMYGGLFFIGIMLSIVFIFAAVLIIYYKQVSEGYEDRARFEVMQKVGMTRREIRRSINSQVLTVFFMPLITAGLHLAFAFPLVWKILQLFELNNKKLLILVTLGCFLVFALFYAAVYRITSNTYFGIVSGAKDRK